MSIGTILGLLLVVGLGSVYAFRPSRNGSEPSSDQYILSVEWMPGHLNHEVDIHVTVDGVTFIQDTSRMSPWVKTMAAEKGATVVLRAITSELAHIDCHIAVNGLPMAHQEKAGPAVVQCAYP